MLQLRHVKMKNTNPLSVWVRPGTTDEKVVPEVLTRRVYEKPRLGFFIEPRDRWLDLGGNIGTFVLLCLVRGVASVSSYEPEPENFALMRRNVEENFPNAKNVRLVSRAVSVRKGTMPLYLCKGDYNKYRHTLCPKRGRSVLPVGVEAVLGVLKKSRADCLKMDIEGAETGILEFLSASQYRALGIRKLVFEYSFDVDKSIPRFMAIIRRLREYFPRVHYDKVKEHELVYDYFPACTLVYCFFL
jgi:FkbM family methyltransferase